MKFKNLIKSHHWLSVEMTLLDLYPNQKKSIDGYKTVFENLQTLDPEDDEMLIGLTEIEDDTDDDNELESSYVDVSGRKTKPEEDEISDSYALEFTRWENWLGMDLAPETLENFTELEIIAHCLFEMTFRGYEQDVIQSEMDSMKRTIEEYKDLTEEEKREQTISLEDLMKKLRDPDQNEK